MALFVAFFHFVGSKTMHKKRKIRLEEFHQLLTFRKGNYDAGIEIQAIE